MHEQEVPKPKLYKLRKLKLKKRKHPRQLIYLDDQAGQFLQSNTASMASYPSIGKFRILSQIRAASVRKVAPRVRNLEEAFAKRAAADLSIQSILPDPQKLPSAIPVEERAFHPLETTDWESKIILADDEYPAVEDRLVPLYAKIGPEPVLQTSRSNMSRPSTPLSASASLLALLTSSNSGHTSRSNSRPGTPPLQPPAILAPPSVNILRNPRNTAARFVNEDLLKGHWMDTIIFDDTVLPAALPPTRLLLTRFDPNMIFDTSSSSEKTDVQALTMKDLSRLNKMILKAKAKRGMGLPAVPVPAKPVMLNFSKPTTNDRYNLSNDKYYEASTVSSSTKRSSSTAQEESGRSVNIAVAKAAMAARVGLQHSVTALKLISPFFRTHWDKNQLRHWHRPVLTIDQGALMTFSPIKKNRGVKDSDAMQPVASVIRNAKGLTLKDGSDYLLVEYSEEYPPLVMNVGMATFIYNYQRKPGDLRDPLGFNQPDHQSVQSPKQQNDDPLGLPMVLKDGDQSPFWIFGDIPPGGSQLTIQNNLFRAPIFPHASNSTDFLAILTHTKGSTTRKLYLRELPERHVLVGQTFPTVEVFGPHSRKHNAFCRNRVQVYAYRLFAKDAEMKGHDKVGGHSDKIQTKLKISRILHAFPQFSEGSVRKWLKDYAESIRGGSDSGSWALRPDAPTLSEDDLRSLVTPESVCQYESMLAGQQRLADAGCISEVLEFANPDGEDGLLDEELGCSGELRLAPWNTTANFINATMGKCWLQLSGAGDPSGGRGDGFSFVKIPSKLAQARLTASDPLTETTAAAAAARKKMSNEQIAYRTEIAKIWKAQLKALSDSTPPPDEEPAITQTDSSVTSPANTPWTDLKRRPTDDDGLSVVSRATSATGVSQASRSRQLVITRTRLTESGPVIETETVTDPRIINAYLRQRQSWEMRRKRKAVAAAASAARVKKIRKLAGSLEESGGDSQRPKDPKAAKPTKSITCGTCGMIGHMKTNRICPRYAEYEAEVQRNASVISESSSIENMTGRMESTKISISLASLNSQKSTLAEEKPVIKLKIPKPSDQAPQVVKAVPSPAKFEANAELQKLSSVFVKVLDHLTSIPESWPFHKPVPKRDYPHYYRIISKPVDLSTIKSRVKRMFYKSVEKFMEDVSRIRDNCIKFNTAAHPFSVTAKSLVEEAEDLVQKMLSDSQDTLIQSTNDVDVLVENEVALIESGIEEVDMAVGSIIQESTADSILSGEGINDDPLTQLCSGSYEQQHHEESE